MPEQEEEPREAQANWTEAAEDPSQRSDETQANPEQEGKPRSITVTF